MLQRHYEHWWECSIVERRERFYDNLKQKKDYIFSLDNETPLLPNAILIDVFLLDIGCIM